MTNHKRFIMGLDVSSLIQYRHMPNHKKNEAIVPTTPKTPAAICIQIVTRAISSHPNRNGVKAKTKGTETRKSLAACGETIQLSLNRSKKAKGPT